MVWNFTLHWNSATLEIEAVPFLGIGQASWIIGVRAYPSVPRLCDATESIATSTLPIVGMLLQASLQLCREIHCESKVSYLRGQHPDRTQHELNQGRTSTAWPRHYLSHFIDTATLLTRPLP